MMVIEDSKPNKRCAAYWLSPRQLIRKLLEARNRPEAVEDFVLGPYRTFLIAITDLRPPATTTSMRRTTPIRSGKPKQAVINPASPVLFRSSILRTHALARSNLHRARARENAISATRQ
jgi:hypothetical protein